VFCREHACEEYALFALAVIEAKLGSLPPSGQVPPEAVKNQVDEIYHKYIQFGALYEIRVPQKLHKHLQRDFTPHIKKTKKGNPVKKQAGGGGKGRVFISGLATLFEPHDEVDDNDTEKHTATTTPTQPLASTITSSEVNYRDAIDHLCMAADFAITLLDEKVSTRGEGAGRTRPTTRVWLWVLAVFCRIIELQYFHIHPLLQHPGCLMNDNL